MEATAPDRQERRLMLSVMITGALVLVAALALAFTLGVDHSMVTTLPSRTPAVASGHVTVPRAKSTHPARARPKAKQTNPSGPMPTGTGTAPDLLSLSPSGGGSGEQVTVSGAEFMSADGLIVAHVDGEAAATSCPTQTWCQVTVPQLTGSPRAVPVTITTEAGTSGTLTFHYV
jgi:hypothetical protein